MYVIIDMLTQSKILYIRMCLHNLNKPRIHSEFIHSIQSGSDVRARKSRESRHRYFYHQALVEQLIHNEFYAIDWMEIYKFNE